MKTFSELLDKYILRSGHTGSFLEEKSGLKRSNISQLRSGSRKTRNIEGLEKLLNQLSLSPEEHGEILRAFWIDRCGKSLYELRREMVDMFMAFKPTFDVEVMADVNINLLGVRTILNSMDLKFYIKGILEREASRGEGEIRLVLQGGNPEIYNELSTVLRINKDIRVDQIICFQSSREERVLAAKSNVVILKEIAPVILAAEGDRYKVNYYYGDISIRFGMEGRMPYGIITRDAVVHISSDMSKAFVTTNKDEIHLYNLLYDEQKKHTKEFYKRIQSGERLLEHLNDEKYYKKDSISSIMAWPSICLLPTGEMMEKYIDKDCKIYSLLKEINSYPNGQKHGSKSNVSYFSKEGVRMLMDEGTFTQVPEIYYNKIEPSDRLLLLRFLIESIEKNNIKARLINESVFTVNDSLSLYVTHEGRFMLFIRDKCSEINLIFEERTISEAILGLIDFVGESRASYSAKDTLLFLKHQYDYYEKKYNIEDK